MSSNLELPITFKINKPSDWLDFFQKRLDEQTLLKEESLIVQEGKVKKKKIKKAYEKFMTQRNQYGATQSQNDINDLKQFEDSKDIYKDKDSAQGDRFTPLARKWINQEMQKFLLTNSNTTTDNKQKEKEEKQLDIQKLHDLDFELKFHIICFIPTFTKRETVSARSSPTSKLFNLYFNNNQQKGVPFINQLDSNFVTFHKFRLISKTVKQRMERKLLEMEIENFNLANIFMRFFNMRTNQFEVDLNNLEFMHRFACLLCYLNSRKEFLGLQKLLKLSLLSDDFEIYGKVDIVKNVVKRTLLEMYHLKTDTAGLIINNTIPYEQKKEDPFDKLNDNKKDEKDIDVDNDDDIDWYENGEEEEENKLSVYREESIELIEEEQQEKCVPLLLNNNNNGSYVEDDQDNENLKKELVGLPEPPKKAPSAHKLYHLENRQKVKEQNPQMTFVEVTSELARLWDNLEDEERKKYREKAKEGMINYYKDLEEYEKKKREFENEELNDEDKLELTEEELIQELDDKSTNNNMNYYISYNSLFKSLKQQQEEDLKEKKKTQFDTTTTTTLEEQGITLVTAEEIEFENEDLSITEPSKLSLIYSTTTENVKPEDGIVTIPAVCKSENYTSVSLMQSFSSPIYSFEGYFSKALRFRLVTVLPTLFGDYEHLGLNNNNDREVMNSVVLCRNLVLFGLSPWGFLSNLLLHIFIEKGISSPPQSSNTTTNDDKKKEEKSNEEEEDNETLSGVEGLTLINFTYDQILQAFSNDRAYYPSQGNYETKPTNECAILGKFRKTVKHVNLIDYGDYIYSLCNEVMVLQSFLPNITSVNVIAKTREYSPATTQLDNVFNGTEADLRTYSNNMKSAGINKIVVIAEGKTPSQIDVSSSSGLGAHNNWGATTTTNDDDNGDDKKDDKKLEIISDALFTSDETIAKQLDIEGNNVEELNFKKKVTKSKTFYLRFMVTPQVKVETLSKLVEEYNLRLEIFPLVPRLLFQTNGLSILEKKKIIDYIVKEKQIPVEMIDFFTYDYTEEWRILSEYSSCLANLYNNGRLTNFNHLAFDSNVLWLTTLMYFGYDIRGKVENSTEFEETILGLQLAAPTMIQVEKEVFNPLYDIFISLIYKRYAPKEKLIEFLDKKMKIFIYDKNPSVEKLSNLIDELDKEKNVTLNDDLPDSSERMLRQLYILFFNNPNCQIELNVDKLFILLVIAIFERDLKKVDAILALEKYIPNFTEVFKKTITFQYLNRGVNDYYGSTNTAFSSTNYTTKYEGDPLVIDVAKWVTRKWSMIQSLYKDILPKHDNFYKLSSLTAEEEEIESIEFNILNLVITQAAPTTLIMSVINRMTPEDLLYQDNLGNTCLHLCVLQVLTDEKLYLQLLSKQPKLANVVNYQLNSALHFACYQSFDSLCLVGEKLVREYGANVNVVNCFGMTPFEVALCWGSKEFMNGTIGDGVVDWISVLGPNGWLRPTLKSKKEIWRRMFEKL